MDNIIFDFGPIEVQTGVYVQSGSTYFNNCEAEQHVILYLRKNTSNIGKREVYKPIFTVQAG